MTHRNIFGHWTDWIDRDDRSLAMKIVRKKPNYVDLPPHLLSLLEIIVTSLLYRSHTRFGVKEVSARIKPEIERYLDHLYKTSFFENTLQKWRFASEGPWSLAFLLSRNYLRFQSQHGTALANISSRVKHQNIEPFLGTYILDAFDSMTDDIADDQLERLIYQLHLNGLVEIEIAALLAQPVKTIEQSIKDSKELLLGTLSSPPAKRWGT